MKMYKRQIYREKKWISGYQRLGIATWINDKGHEGSYQADENNPKLDYGKDCTTH